MAGVLRDGETIASLNTGSSHQVSDDDQYEVGHVKVFKVKTLAALMPDETPVPSLYPGQVGVFTANMRSTSEAVAGDTFHRLGTPVEPVISLAKPKPMVYAGNI